jgi:hypothetical protein
LPCMGELGLFEKCQLRISRSLTYAWSFLSRAIGILAIAPLGACAIPPQQPTDDALKAAYASALADARDAEQTEIKKELVWISPANSELVWSPNKERVLVVTWTDWDGYDDAVGHETRLSRQVWVTAVPELQRRCQAFPADINLTLRMKQLLGLPPHDNKTSFVQLWVHPRDMFRPAPDPEINDSMAGLDFPVSARATVSS